MAQLHALVAGHAEEPAQVVVGIETERGLWVAALVAAGYLVYAINPKAVSRYRERYGGGSGANSDAAGAKVLGDLVRTDRHNHRPVAGDSELVEAVYVLARAHQRMIWSRQRKVKALRATLREFYPAVVAAFRLRAGLLRRRGCDRTSAHGRPGAAPSRSAAIVARGSAPN
jgi:hypothetical protein